MAAMSCVEGPFGPGFRFRREEENSRRYFRWTSALWNLNSVAGLRLGDAFANAMWAHGAGGQPEHKAIERGEIRRTLSGAIADQELMLEQESLSCDPAHAARAEEFFARVTSRWIARRGRSRRARQPRLLMVGR